MTRMKTAGSNLPIPQDDSEARETIREIGDLNRAVVRLEAELNDRVAELQQEFGERAAPLREQAKAKTEGLQMFCEVNRDRLTSGGKVKYHRFATGEISWRQRPAKVTIRGTEDVIRTIQAARLGKRFLREKIEIDKEAMLADRVTASGIKGVTIGSEGEDFIVAPFETDLAEGV